MLDLGDLLEISLPDETPRAVDAAVVVVVAEGAAAAVVVELDVLVVALKHFWHILLVAGLPVNPQLLTHKVRVSGTLNSVSSFSVF